MHPRAPRRASQRRIGGIRTHRRASIRPATRPWCESKPAHPAPRSLGATQRWSSPAARPSHPPRSCKVLFRRQKAGQRPAACRPATTTRRSRPPRGAPTRRRRRSPHTARLLRPLGATRPRQWIVRPVTMPGAARPLPSQWPGAGRPHRPPPSCRGRGAAICLYVSQPPSRVDRTQRRCACHSATTRDSYLRMARQAPRGLPIQPHHGEFVVEVIPFQLL